MEKVLKRHRKYNGYFDSIAGRKCRVSKVVELSEGGKKKITLEYSDNSVGPFVVIRDSLNSESKCAHYLNDLCSDSRRAVLFEKEAKSIGMNPIQLAFFVGKHAPKSRKEKK